MDNSSKIEKVLSVSTAQDMGWIIDSEATEHMTYNKSLFQYMTPPLKKNVITTNGETTPIVGTGSIMLTPTISLYNC